MIKATVLYGHPKDTDAFEKYYSANHLPLVSKTPGIARAELTKFLPNADGSAPAYYRMAELYFESPAQMQKVLSSPEGQEMATDLANFATGGVTIMFGLIEN